MRMGSEETDLEVDEAVELIPRADRRVVQDGLELRDELFTATHEDLAEQIVLVLEERIDGADGELRQLGDLLQRRLMKALATEDLLGRIEQLGPADVLLTKTAFLASTRLLRRPRHDPTLPDSSSLNADSI